MTKFLQHNPPPKLKFISYIVLSTTTSCVIIYLKPTIDILNVIIIIMNGGTSEYKCKRVFFYNPIIKLSETINTEQ